MLKQLKEIISLAIPAVAEMILYMLIWVFDTLMVGKAGGQIGVSAVGLSSEIMYTFINILIGMGLAISITSLVARSMGENNSKKAQEFANQGIKLGLFIAFFMFLIFFIFSKTILKSAGAEVEVLNLGKKYMRICSVGMFFNMCSNLLSGVYRGCKDTKTPLLGAFILNVINISFDYLLIFGKFGFPKLGVEGAAYATTLGNIFCFLILLYKSRKLPFKLSLKNKINFKEIKDLINLAVPSGLQEGAFSIVRLLGALMVMRLGSLAFSANQIVITIESISFMPGWGFAISSVALVGHSMGEKNYKKSEKYAKGSLLLASLVMGFFSIIFLVFPHHLVGLFIKKSEVDVIRLGTICLMIGAIQQVPMAISMVLGGVLKGYGDSKLPFKITLFTNWGIRLPLMIYFIYLNKMPITYFWVITTIQWSLECIILIIFYKRKTSKFKKYIEV